MASIFTTYRVGNLPFQLISRHYSRANPLNFLRRKRMPKVAVLNLRGTIEADMKRQGGFGGAKKLNLETLYKPIDKAFAIPNLKEVCLVVNSPGGSAVQSELIANRILHLSKHKNVHVVSFVEDYGASGGYWLACIGKEIYTAQNSVVGSIGVLSMSFGLDKFIQNYDIESRMITSGKNKAMWSPFQPEVPEHRAIMERVLHRVYVNFTNFVKQQREGKLKAEDDVLFTGEMWVGEDAVNLGLVDGVKTLSDYLHEKYGDDVNVVTVNQPKSGIFDFRKAYGPSISDIEHMMIQKKYTFL